MSMPKMPEVVSRTVFTLHDDDFWYWETKALNNEVVNTGGEGCKSLQEALNGFFLQQGIQYEQFGSWPEQFGPMMRLPENKYQINKFVTN